MFRRAFRFAFFVLCFTSPLFAATITVTATDDTITAGDGKVTLREAITAINAGNTLGDADIAAQNPGTFGTNDTINFAIAGAGAHMIALASNLPNLNKTVFINGYSQSGASPNSNALNAGINAVLQIEIAAPSGGIGLQALADGTTIRGLAIHGYKAILVGASNVVIAGNFIGADAAGTTALPGALGVYCVQVFSFGSTIPSNVTIGGPNNADRNLIVPAGGSGSHGLGVQLPYVAPGPGTGYVIQGNYIGTDITGNVALSQGEGLDAISNAFVYGNLISGNPGGAVQLMDNNTLQGNLIGTQRDGISALPNGNYGGIEIHGGNSVIGYPSPAPPNVIAHNTGYGIVIYNAATQGSSNINTRNQIAFNSIYNNGSLGISLDYSPFVLANDVGDGDTWVTDKIGNDGQNYPVINSATVSGNSVTVAGTLNSLAQRAFELQFFASAACAASGYGQGQTFIGSKDVVTDASGNASFGPLSFTVPAGQSVITSTAIDISTPAPRASTQASGQISGQASGNTSEFSQCLTASGGPNPTTTVVTSSLNPALAGQNVTFTANIVYGNKLATGDSATQARSLDMPMTPSAVTGTISFSDGASMLATVPAVGDSAAFTTSSLIVGTHPITATYSGDAVYAGSSASLSQIITPPAQAAIQSVPTLGAWALVLLVLALGVFVGLHAKRHRQAS